MSVFAADSKHYGQIKQQKPIHMNSCELKNTVRRIMIAFQLFSFPSLSRCFRCLLIYWTFFISISCIFLFCISKIPAINYIIKNTCYKVAYHTSLIKINTIFNKTNIFFFYYYIDKIFNSFNQELKTLEI